MPWKVAAEIQQLKSSEKLCLEIDDTPLLMFWWKENAYAIENKCSHAFKPLENGVFLNGIIQCPFHGARFCITSGEHLSPPAFKGIRTFATRISNGMIEVNI